MADDRKTSRRHASYKEKYEAFLMMRREKMGAAAVAEALGRSLRTIYNWREQTKRGWYWYDLALKSQREARGRKSALAGTDWIALLICRPEEFGAETGLWRPEDVQIGLWELGRVKVSPKTIKRHIGGLKVSKHQGVKADKTFRLRDEAKVSARIKGMLRELVRIAGEKATAWRIVRRFIGYPGGMNTYPLVAATNMKGEYWVRIYEDGVKCDPVVRAAFDIAKTTKARTVAILDRELRSPERIRALKSKPRLAVYWHDPDKGTLESNSDAYAAAFGEVGAWPAKKATAARIIGSPVPKKPTSNDRRRERLRANRDTIKLDDLLDAVNRRIHPAPTGKNKVSRPAGLSMNRLKKILRGYRESGLYGEHIKPVRSASTGTVIRPQYEKGLIPIIAAEVARAAAPKSRRNN